MLAEDQTPGGDDTLDDAAFEAVNQEVGSNVRAMMAKYNVKGTEIAGRLGMTPSSLSTRLHGRTPFKAHELVLIAQRLGVPVESFLVGVPVILVLSSWLSVVPESGPPELDLDYGRSPPSGVLSMV